MTVDSYLELFTTMYGWGFAKIFRDVLIGTGLIYLPFIMLILGTWMEAHRQASTEGADAGWMIRVMEVELGTALFVLAFCFTTVPGLDFSKIHLRYTPEASMLEPDPATVDAASVGTFSDSFSEAPATVEIPPWWYTVMGLSSGLTQAVKAGIGNDMVGFRRMEEMARLASINDPQLLGQIVRFNQECFIRARSQYYAATTVPSGPGEAALSTFGPTDVEWIGSHFYQVEPGYYDSMFAAAPVVGFAVSATDDADVAGSAIPPDAGRPSCNMWWEQLKTDILAKYVVKSVPFLTPLTKVAGAAFGGAVSPEMTAEDAVVKLAINRMRPPMTDESDMLGDSRTWKDKLINAPFATLGYLGSFFEGTSKRIEAETIKPFMTMMQPLILMAVYMFLPLIVVIGRYSLQVMFLGGLAIFTIKMWPLMWFIARLIDDHLVKAMYPDLPTMIDQLVDTSVATFDGLQKRTILNILQVSLYVGLPLVWSAMMGWVGINIMHQIAAVKKAAVNSAASAAQNGGKIGKLATRYVTPGKK